jgi:hydroxyacylglutathione hydrolase
MGVADGERYSLGDVQLEFLHTPGHTPESMSIVIYEHADDTVPYGVLTGDTLFIGDVGRPDLLSSIGFTRDELADKLYDSLHNKLMPLPDQTKVYPAHGAGSACGKNLSTDLWSTMGEQRKTNYALRASSKEKFVELVTEGQPPAPGYFVYNAILNRQGRELLDEAEMPRGMSYDEVRAALAEGAILVDGRDPEEFALGHLKGAVNIGLEGRYAEFAGSVIKPEDDIVLVTDPERALEGKNRLGRIGFDRVIGYLKDPYAVMFENRQDVAVASRLTTNALDERIADVPELQLVDVRNPGEAAAGMIASAVNIPVGQLPDRVGELDPRKPTVVYCAGGYRSSVAASLLRQRGFEDVSDLLGGYNAWDEAVQNA